MLYTIDMYDSQFLLRLIVCTSFFTAVAYSKGGHIMVNEKIPCLVLSYHDKLVHVAARLITIDNHSTSRYNLISSSKKGLSRRCIVLCSRSLEPLQTNVQHL